MLIVGTDLRRAESQICDLLIIVSGMSDRTTQMAQYIVALERLIGDWVDYLRLDNPKLAESIQDDLDNIKRKYEM